MQCCSNTVWKAETAWTEAGNTRVAYYSNLPPGHYYFHVIASNEDGVSNGTGSVLEILVQPQFWQTGWFLAAIIVSFLGLVVAVVRYLSTQKLHRQLQALKQQEALEKERSRIARDLHDQLGANLTQVALLGEMAESDKNSPGEIESHAQQISQTAREKTRSLDEIVWAVNPSNDTLDGLINYACKYAQEYLALAGLRYRAEVPAQLPAMPIPPEVRHNVFLAFKEAINNVDKHAQASEVWIRLRLQPDNFALSVEDNGRGRAGARQRKGETVSTTCATMEDIGGKFEAGAAPERETLFVEELFAANNIEENLTLQALQTMPVNQRRHSTVFLLGDSFQTLSPSEGFKYSVHAVVSSSEMFLLKQLVEKTVAENNLFLNSFREVQARVYSSGTRL